MCLFLLMNVRELTTPSLVGAAVMKPTATLCFYACATEVSAPPRTSSVSNVIDCFWSVSIRRLELESLEPNSLFQKNG